MSTTTVTSSEGTPSVEALKSKTQSHERYEELGVKLQELKKKLSAEEEKIKKLKAIDKTSPEVKEVEKNIKSIKNDVNKLTKEWRKADPNKLVIDVSEFEEHLLRRFFVVPSFEIYGGTSGLYDLGPVACAVKANVLSLWRRHFVIEENMLEIDTPCLTIESVFKASGHVDRFVDYMVRDVVTSDYYRADKLLAEHIENELANPKTTSEQAQEYNTVLKEMDGYDKKTLSDALKKYGVKAPLTKNDLGEPEEFNLMFPTQIGPTGKYLGYLRPETAQGIFVNFKRLLDYNGGQVPFAAATIGQAFRNEISPRSGLLRVREFTLAEIEHFMNPKYAKEAHPKFDKVKDVNVPLLGADLQAMGKTAKFITIGEAYDANIIKNSTLAYYIGRTYQFMINVGILPSAIRFRQHMPNEMAHYACDCWDCELLTSYGWIECVGLADRSCFDLSAHSKSTKTELVAYEEYKTPIYKDEVELKILNKAKFAALLKAERPVVEQYLNSLSNEEKLDAQKKLEEEGKIVVNGFEISKELIQFKMEKKKIAGENFAPSVIEPSFGIGRIIYCILEHCFWKRVDEEEQKQDKKKSKAEKKVARVVFSFPPAIAPVKAAVLPLQNNSKFDPVVNALSEKLTSRGISNKVDNGGQAIGKRYSRMDDIGVPLVITVDFKSVDDETITVRERDSCTQIRAPIDEAVEVIARYVEGKMTWSEIRDKYPEQKEEASSKVGKQTSQ